jgi:ribosomal protein S18 acetylase RimI-like enzyme
LTHPLDNPIWHALTGPQSHLGLGGGAVRRFRPEVAPFAVMEVPSEANWALLSELLPDQATAALVTTMPVAPPQGLELVRAMPLAQMVLSRPIAGSEATEMMPLTFEDVPAMQELVALTEPGPFAARTIEFGGYIGIRDGGRLVAMAGERLRVVGYAEVSAVCTHPDYRGRGYAKVLVTQVARGIGARGETPFLHVVPHNKAAISTYERLGFVQRRVMELTVVRKPRQD